MLFMRGFVGVFMFYMEMLKNVFAGGVDGLLQSIADALTSVLFFNVLSIFGITNVKFPLTIAITFVVLVVLTVRIRFMNFRDTFTGLKLMFSISSPADGNSADDVKVQVNPVKAMFSVLSGSAGFGHTVGVVALFATLPSNVAFWSLLWLTVGAVVLMPLRFAEVYVGHKYREKLEDGSFVGGPRYYMRKGLAAIGLPKLGVFLGVTYAICTVFSSFGGGSSFQSNQAVKMLTSKISFLQNKELLVAFLFTCLVSLMVFGNMKRITSFLTYVMPFTVVAYLLVAIIVLAVLYKDIVPTIVKIANEALSASPKDMISGIFVSFLAIMTRVAIAAEIGLGTAPVMHSASYNKDSLKEAFLSTASPILSTWMVCIVSALLVLVTGVYTNLPVGVGMFYGAVNKVSPYLSYVIMCSFFLMSLNVVTAWSVYGARNIESLFAFGSKEGKIAKLIYQLVFILVVFVAGRVRDLGVILQLTDVVNTSVLLPNSITLVLLSGVIAKAYLKKEKKSEKK